MTADPALTMDEITALEAPGDLMASLRALEARWDAGCHDTETARRRAFLYWWSCAEPEFLTGLPRALGTVPFEEMRGWLMEQPVMDPETRFTLGWMLASSPWCCGAVRDLEERGQKLLSDHDADATSPSFVFDLRSEYGRYFEHILKSRGAVQSMP